jgi:hypothetical protein
MISTLELIASSDCNQVRSVRKRETGNFSKGYFPAASPFGPVANQNRPWSAIYRIEFFAEDRGHLVSTAQFTRSDHSP